MWQVHGKHVGQRYKFKVLTLRHSDAPLDESEDQAMGMAMYSRSPASIEDHIAKVNERGSQGFMQTFYCGYGHDSIGDCAEGSVYVEGVSMLAAKHLQNHPLYRGQEASTRYLDFSKAEFIVPGENPAGRAYVEKLRAFYIKARPVMVALFAKRNGVDMDAVPERDKDNKLTKEGAALVAAKNAVNAKAFDVVRGFLPFGAATNVAVAMTVRQLRDHSRWLEASAVDEVVDIGETVLEALRNRYANSFVEKPEDYERLHKAKLERAQLQRQLVELELLNANAFPSDCSLVIRTIDPVVQPPDTLHRKTGGLPPGMGYYLPELWAEFLIDIGSYRDVQRQQSVTKNFPIASTRFGVEKWYLQQLDESLLEEAIALLAEAESATAQFKDPLEAQYVVPMAYQVNFCMRGNWDKFDYITELRSKTTIHPTLRRKVAEMARQFNELSPLKLRFTESEDVFDIRRGTQTITEK